MRYINKDKKSTSFYCFSPPVMIATFAIEIFLAMYLLFRYHMNNTIKIIIVALGSLAMFQLAEYNVCGGSSGQIWSRVGYVAITALPALGLHLLSRFKGQGLTYLNKVAYASMGFLMIYFVFSANAFSGYECTGNYVIFQLSSFMTKVYMLYYYGWLLTAIVLGLIAIASKNTPKDQKSSISALLVGYAVFLIPTAIVITINPQTTSGIPSIMCGFAVFFALILGLKVAPKTADVKRRIKLPFRDKEV